MRRAASVVLTRAAGGEVEVYLVERSKRLRFFGGYLAFPGGVVGPEDRGEHAEHELASCALRELFEETGVLLPPLARCVADDERDALREMLLARERSDEAAARWMRTRGSQDLAASIVSLGTLTTPPFAPVRYETRFFHAELPAAEWPSVVPGELTDGAFWQPGEALRRWFEGDVLISPPTLALLRLLDREGPSGFYAAARREAEELEGGALHPVYFTPGVLLAALETDTLPPATTTNTYVVGNRELWIVDPATPHASEQERLCTLLDELAGERRELRGILVTHHHADHVGGVVPLSRRYGLPVYAHALTLERLPDGIGEARALEDGARIDLGRGPDGADDWHLDVLHTPGHDRGHLAFIESRYRAAIVGDMCSTVSTIVIDPPEGHMATYLASLRRLLDAEVGALYPAHGPAARDGQALLRDYLVHRQEREQALAHALADAARTVEDLVPVVYADTDERLWTYAARSLLAGLEKLEEEGRAARDGASWRLVT